MMLGKEKSIRVRLLLPLFIIMLIQAVLFIGIILFGNVSFEMKSNAVKILNENVENSRLHMEKELLSRWMNVINESDALTDGIQTVLDEKGCQPSDLMMDADLNRLVMEEITETMINLLHRSYGTGIFVIIDGPAARNSDEAVKAGIYIRDLDPSSYSVDNSDLLLERGLPSISKAYGIALDSFWELGFYLEEENTETAYFFNPYLSARENKAKRGDEKNYGYLSPPFALNDLDLPVLTYSIPLIMDDGTVIGIAGVDMTVSQMMAMLNPEELAAGGDAISFLGVRDADTNYIRKAVVSGSAYQLYFDGADGISYTDDTRLGISRIDAANGTWFASIHQIDVYSHNTPFEDEEWVLAGIMEEKKLLESYYQLRNTLLVSLLIPLTFSLLGVFITGRIITDPIGKLVKELRGQSQAEQKLSLLRVHVSEIDELTDAIEKLSAAVAENASRVSNILEHANVSIGVFEYREEMAPVFCSRLLFQMLGWGILEEPYTYLEQSDFLNKMDMLKKMQCENEPYLFYREDPDPTWMRLIIVQQAGSVLGVLTDVTAQEQERRKLQRERDFDLLTDILNRRGFLEQVEKQLGRVSLGAMVMWDLDNLKYVNDTYGHDEGDRYIQLFANHLRQLEKKGAVICRYSGDEFLTFLYGATSQDELRERMQDFMLTLQNTGLLMVNGYKIPLRVSAGLCWYPADTDRYDTLINYADFAMYTVKHSIKGVFLEFDMKSYLENSYLLEGQEELNRMLEQRSVDFAFQPVVTRSGAVYGYELLMRPQLKNLKGIGEVLNLAKVQAKLTQMEVLTWTAGLKKCEQQIQAGKIKDGEKLFINSIANVNLPKSVIDEILREYSGILNRVVLEITESEPVNYECFGIKLDAVRKMEAMLAVDDFGSGYNSEGLLLKIHPNIIKLDMDLIRNIDRDQNRQHMIRHMTDFAKQSEIMVLAEGVETYEELETLMGFGIDLFQGYYLGRPELEIRQPEVEAVEKLSRLADKRLEITGFFEK